MARATTNPSDHGYARVSVLVSRGTHMLVAWALSGTARAGRKPRCNAPFLSSVCVAHPTSGAHASHRLILGTEPPLAPAVVGTRTSSTPDCCCMTIRERTGNIFESGCQTLTVTVNTVGDMGAGIAKEARLRFPDMAEAYREQCETRELQIGKLWLWKHSDPWILCFPTKTHWRQPSRLSYVRTGLAKLADSYRHRGITRLAMPHLGTAHGGLSWEAVRPLVHQYLAPLIDLEVHLYGYDPAAPDAAFEAFATALGTAEPSRIAQELGLRQREAKLVAGVLANPPVRNLSAFHAAPGLGDATLTKIYQFLFHRPHGSTLQLRMPM